MDQIEDIRVTDSGVESEQTSISTNSILEEIRRDESISVVAEESSDDVSSICSTENIEKELVGKIKNMFEERISETKERQSTFMNWKKSNLIFKPKEFSTIPAGVTNEKEKNVQPIANMSRKSSDSESSDSTVENLNVATPAERQTRQLEHVSMLTTANVDFDGNKSSSNSSSDDEQEKNEAIGKDSVNRLKSVYEEIATTSKEYNAQNMPKSSIRSTSSMMNLRSSYMKTSVLSMSLDDISKENTRFITEKDNFDTKQSSSDRSSDDEDQENENLNSVENSDAIEKDIVNKLKSVYEEIASSTKVKNAQNVPKVNFRKTSSLMNLNSGNPD